MDNAKVSIIVPLYNVERFIEKCVFSILNQDYSNIEIILVDDGSPDNSGVIADELKKKDQRINVIHQNNCGVSAARNVGLTAASGEYVTFVDGDDWIESDYVSYFVHLMKKHKCDVAMNKNNYTETRNVSREVDYVVNAEKVMEWIYKGDIFVAVWNKMYKTSFLKENNIMFNPSIWYGEGMLFNIECLQYTNEVIICEKSVYHQTFNIESAMRKFNLESNFCGLKSLELQKKIWKKKNKAIELAWNYHKYCFNRSIIDGLVRSNMVKDNKDVYDKCVKNLRANILIPLRAERSVKKKIVWGGYFLFPYMMAVRRSLKYKFAAKLGDMN